MGSASQGAAYMSLITAAEAECDWPTPEVGNEDDPRNSGEAHFAVRTILIPRTVGRSIYPITIGQDKGFNGTWRMRKYIAFKGCAGSFESKVQLLAKIRNLRSALVRTYVCQHRQCHLFVN